MAASGSRIASSTWLSAQVRSVIRSRAAPDRRSWRALRAKAMFASSRDAPKGRRRMTYGLRWVMASSQQPAEPVDLGRPRPDIADDDVALRLAFLGERQVGRRGDVRPTPPQVPVDLHDRLALEVG